MPGHGKLNKAARLSIAFQAPWCQPLMVNPFVLPGSPLRLSWYGKITEITASTPF